MSLTDHGNQGAKLDSPLSTNSISSLSSNKSTDCLSARSHCPRTSPTESSPGENRDDSSGDTGVRVLEVGVKLVIAVRNDRADNSRVVSEQKRPNGTKEMSQVSKR